MNESLQKMVDELFLVVNGLDSYSAADNGRKYVTALRDEVVRLEKENEILRDSRDSWKEECEDLRKHYSNIAMK